MYHFVKFNKTWYLKPQYFDSPTWDEIEVNEDELIDYIIKGYAIKINC